MDLIDFGIPKPLHPSMFSWLYLEPLIQAFPWLVSVPFVEGNK